MLELPALAPSKILLVPDVLFLPVSGPIKILLLDVIEFNRNDIVRSELVKSYIIAREELEEQGIINPL